MKYFLVCLCGLLLGATAVWTMPCRVAIGNNVQNIDFVGAQIDFANRDGRLPFRSLRTYLHQQTASPHVVIADDAAAYNEADSGTVKFRGADFSAFHLGGADAAEMTALNTNLAFGGQGSVKTATLGRFTNVAFIDNAGAIFPARVDEIIGVDAGVVRDGVGAQRANIARGYGVRIRAVQADEAWGLYQDGSEPNRFGGMVQFDGGIQMKIETALTTCRADRRGQLHVVATAQGDKLFACLKNAQGNYVWHEFQAE